MPSLWMLVRASGTVDIVLLTGTLALGISVIGRGGAAVPRFFLQHVHRDMSLIAVVLLVAHVVAAVALLHLSAIASLVPFASQTRRLYLGLGVLGADIMVAIAVTSLLRFRLGVRRWRHLHLTAYAAWAAAIVHGAAPGTDVGVPWVRYLDILCFGVVVTAGLVRLTQLQRQQPLSLVMGGAVAALVLLGFVAWVHATPSSTTGGSQTFTPIAQTDVTEN